MYVVTTNVATSSITCTNITAATTATTGTIHIDFSVRTMKVQMLINVSIHDPATGKLLVNMLLLRQVLSLYFMQQYVPAVPIVMPLLGVFCTDE